MNEIKPSETYDIAREKDKIQELSKNFALSEIKPPWTVEQANLALEKRLGGRTPEEISHPEKLYAKDWGKISEPHEIEKDIYACNPNFRLGENWQKNCQRCVPTFEMRRRGYDVTAMPKMDDGNCTDISYYPFSVWENPQIILCRGDGILDIQNCMRQWGNGARAQITVNWRGVPSGHTFVAEQVNGETKFYDPQNGSLNAAEYFKQVAPGSVQLCRIDQLEPTSRILECCKKA